MIRSVWLALIFLGVLGALAAFKVGVATPSKQQAALADDVVEPEATQDALPKADRLAAASETKPVQAIAIVPQPAVAAPAEKIIKIKSRHWSDSNAWIKKRKIQRQRGVRKKHRRRG